MTKKILIDASHTEETRVVVLENGQLTDYDFSVRAKEELKGNIYLAKITKVEASLQAAFVDYGGKKQGFLPFDEINIKYFNITKAQYEEIIEKQKQYKEELKKKRKARKNGKNQSNSNSTIINDNPTILSEEDNNDSKNSIIDQEDNNNAKNNIHSKNFSLNYDEDDDFIEDDEFLKQAELENSAYGTRYGYKIQDVISNGQMILVQVIKEERGNKGAALSSYISIPGRYCVLMPYTPFKVSISKKIRNYNDRVRLKSLVRSLNIPPTNNLILRTASLQKSDDDIIQDYNYVKGIWDLIEKHVSTSKKPDLILEEGSIIKKVIRDIYSANVEEIVIEGTKAYNTAKLLAKALAPEIVSKIIKYNNPKTTLLKYYKVDEEVNNIYSPVVFLKSGGYIVINSTEALVAIDVNSGKSKGKQNVEETALKTNTEAVAEIMKQIKLRDIGGLVVIDFIDMENTKNRTIIEKLTKDLARADKAKIAIAPLSQFGLLEISRQRIKASLAEKIFHVCPKCHGIGYVKPLELNALNILRNLKKDIENKKIELSSTQAILTLPNQEAFYLLNNKRHSLNELEDMLHASIIVECDDDITYPFYKIEDMNLQISNNSTALFLEQEIEANLQKYNEQLTSNNKKLKIRLNIEIINTDHIIIIIKKQNNNLLTY